MVSIISRKQDSDWKLCEASKPAEQGNLSIVVNKQTFSDSNKPEIIIFKVEGNKKVEIAKVSEYEYGKEINLPVSTGDLEVFVSSVNGSAANISPASISLAKDQTKNVEINLEAPAPAETGQLEISFKNIAQASESVHYTISDSDGHIVRNGHTDFSSPVVFSDLPASDNGVKYTVSFDDYISNGTMYKSKDVTVTVFKHNTTKLDYEFTARPIAAQNVNINLSGLPEDKNITLTLVSDKGETREIQLSGDKSDYSVEIPQRRCKTTITVSSLVGFTALISQNSFTADSSQGDQNITLKFKEKSSHNTNWPARDVVGYVKGYDSKWYKIDVILLRQ